MLKELVNYVDTQTSFTAGTDLMAGYVPDSIKGDCVIFIESGGKPNFYLPDAPQKMIQVLSKATDYHVARANAQIVYDLLHGAVGITLSAILTGGKEYTVNTCEAVSEPQSLGQDERGMFNISTNYILRIQDK